MDFFLFTDYPMFDYYRCDQSSLHMGIQEISQYLVKTRVSVNDESLPFEIMYFMKKNGLWSSDYLVSAVNAMGQ